MAMRVLVFDDDAALGRLVVRAATMAGMTASSVTEPVAFAESLATDPPDLIIMDLQLGATDGVAQIRLLAQWHYTGKLVLISGFDARVLASARTLAHSLGLRVAGILEKPIRIAELETLLVALQSSDRLPTVQQLRDAILNDEMSLDFQPVIRRNPKTLKKLEALIRWDHPVLGRVPPPQFISVAESDMGCMDALTDWVLGAVVEAHHVLAELGVSMPLAMNMSPLNLHDLAVPDRIERRLLAGGMPPQHLQIEITESAAFDKTTHIMDILTRLRLKGVGLSIDDFGTGYSSLKLLREMPFTEIKIDRSFLADLTTSRDSRAIVKSIIDLASNMEMGCVAEGVETEETADLLEQMGARDLQGFLFAQPMPVETIPVWLSIWTQSGSPLPPRPARSPDASGGLPGPEPVHPLPAHAQPAAIGGDIPRLPPRQMEVMRLLAEGCSAKEIARRLNIGVGTVKIHLSLAYSALGARNRVEAIRRAAPILADRPIGQLPPGSG
jgi:EAL domain-containing protein (putative c-di-GMP-specific phosphodiesterase class I)/DNA-binding CsgD family transcriptional regulator